MSLFPFPSFLPYTPGMDKTLWLTTGDVARRCRVDRKTVVRWCESGALEYERVAGGHRRISHAAMARFLEKYRNRIHRV